MNEIEKFIEEVKENVRGLERDKDVQALSRVWVREVARHKYAYNFTWLGRPVIQLPQDIIAMQELIWTVRPDLIIETGIAHGGSLIFSASMLALLDYCEAVESGKRFDPLSTGRRVLGIDIDIREHNRGAIESHPMAHNIEMIQGSSIAPEIIARVHEVAQDYKRILVCLDSNHTYEHVLAELEAYASLVSVDSYCVVFDTLIEDMPDDMFTDRPWGKDDNPKTAVRMFLEDHSEFEVDKEIEHKLLITVSPDGYLRKTCDE